MTSRRPRDPKRVNGPPHPKSIPLSFAQEQVWFLEKLHPQLNSYRFQAVLNCLGALNVDVLEMGLNQVVSRHAILRTAFVAQEDGTPWQEVRSHVPFTLPREDLRFVPEEARQKELKRRIEEELRVPFVSADHRSSDGAFTSSTSRNTACCIRSTISPMTAGPTVSSSTSSTPPMPLW